MNVKLLEKVKQHIIEEPKRFDMALFEVSIEDYPIAFLEYPKCGTVACIAGWACILSGQKPVIWERNAIKLLDIDKDQAARLFFDENWPGKYQGEYLRTKEQSKERAQVACERIDHFIATEGAE